MEAAREKRSGGHQNYEQLSSNDVYNSYNIHASPASICLALLDCFLMVLTLHTHNLSFLSFKSLLFKAPTHI